MNMMRAMVLEKPYHMVLKQVPVPVAGDSEVLIKIKYCGICGSDWGAYTGKYADEAALLPLVIGHEFFGIIEKKGAAVPDSLAVGDRVSTDICLPCGTCYHCRRGEPLLCGAFRQIGIHTAETSGGYSEYVKVPWQNIYKVPSEVTDYQAAFIEPITACLNASEKMDLKIGSSFVVIGAGLGIIHACLAKLRGAAPVIVVDANADRLAMAKRIVADYTINVSDIPDAAEEVRRLTGGVGADYVLEAVGSGKTYELAFSMLRRGGRLEAFGICSDDDYASLRPVEFVLQEKKISGSCAGIGNNWQQAITLLQYKRLDPTPLVSMVVPLEETEDALKELRENKKLVKVLVSPEVTKRVLLSQ
jgi:threonine dehydrogenase-like Zn-dependent dehydrogenase